MKSSVVTLTPKPQLEEDKLVEQAVGGDTHAFAMLYDSYVDRIYRFVFFRVGDHETAQDLTSQIFLKAWEHLGSYEMRGWAFSAWLFRIARNLIIDFYRTRKETVPLEPDGDRNSDPMEDVDGTVAQYLENERLQQAMQHLTGDQRTVLTLKFLEGFSTAEIGQVMGRRQGAIRTLQLRGLRALAKILGGEND